MLEEGSVAGPFHEQVPTTLTLEPHFGSASVGGWSHLRRKYELRLLYTQGSDAEEGLHGGHPRALPDRFIGEARFARGGSAGDAEEASQPHHDDNVEAV